MLSSLIEKEVGGYFVLEYANGSTLSIPMMHLQWFTCEGQSMKFKFTSHKIELNIVNPSAVSDRLLAHSGLYLKEYGTVHIEDRDINAPYIHEVYIED